MKCEWCEVNGAKNVYSTVYWELPDGTRAIEIKDTPGIKCYNCEIEYQSEEIINLLEEQLLLINTEDLCESVTFETLMKTPRLLKRNYFKS